MKRLLLLLLAACGPTVATLPTDPGVPARRAVSADQVEVLAREPARPFAEVAMLLAQSGDRAALVSALRGRAAELGCDAVILDDEIARSGPRAGVGICEGLDCGCRNPDGCLQKTLIPAAPHELDGTCIVYSR